MELRFVVISQAVMVVLEMYSAYQRKILTVYVW